MAIQFDGLELATLPALPINPVAGEVAFDGQLKVYSGVQWETFNPVDPSGNSSTITMAASAVIEGDDGVVGAPAYTFGSDTTYGMYFDGTDTIGLAGNGADILQLTASGTPVNYWEMLSSDAASPVQLKALGSDTNIGMELDPKGTGTVTVADAATYDANVGATSLVTKNYVDTAIGAGAAGADKQIQFNDGGSAFGADADFTWDKTTHDLTVGSVGTPGTVRGPDGTGAGAGADISVTAGRGSGAGDGGATTVSAGDGGITGDGGDLDLISGSGGSTSGSGGDVNVTAGGRQAGAGNGGNVNITAGDGSATGGAAGAVFIRPGYGGATPTIPTASGIPQPAEFWFVDGDNTTPGYVGFKAPADVGAASTGDGVDTVWTLPEGEGASGEFMVTDGAGILSWSSISAAGGVQNPMTADLNLGGFSFLHPVDVYRATNTITDTLDLTFTAQDSTSADQIYGQIITEILNSTDTGERGAMYFDVATFNGGLVRALTIDGSVGVSARVESNTFFRVSANVAPMIELHNPVTAGSNPQIWFEKDDAGAVERYGGKIEFDFTDTTSDSVDTDAIIQTVKDNTTAAKLNELKWDSDGILHLERDKGGTGASAAEARLYEGSNNGADYLGLKAPDSVTQSNVFEMKPKILTVTGTSATIDETDDVVLVDPVTAAGNVTLTLHPAANERFRYLNIKITTQSASYTVTVDGNASETIDGALTYVFPVNSQWSNLTLINDGTAWYIL